MRISILSDIHGNMEAFKSINDIINTSDALILLGDLIDYGPHSNEIISSIAQCKIPVLCNIWGNHEHAVLFEDYSHFSSERGVVSAKYTKDNLDENSWNYIKQEMTNKGMAEFTVNGKKCLAIHGSLTDEYWKAIKPGDDASAYKDYDYVFSGHSHLPHLFEAFNQDNNPTYRNKKKTIFINPGSVGQPRNQCNKAQFVVWDTDLDQFEFVRVNYDIETEQKAFSESIDSFYKERLSVGI